MANIEQSELEAESTSQMRFINICRICLKPGEFSIFGDYEKPDISAEVKAFGNIDISNHDELPQHICISCHELLQGAILFRNTAKESEILIKSIKKGDVKFIYADEEDSNHDIRDGDMSDHCSEDVSLKITEDYNSDTNTFEEGSEVSLYDNENNNAEMIMIVLSDIDNEEDKIQGRNQIKSRDHSCETCKIDFETSDDYYQHIGTPEHTNNMKRFQKLKCNVCAKLICKEYYVSHIIKHSFEPVPFASGIYKCKICNKILFSEQDLKIHKDCETHKMSVRNAHTVDCPVCHKNIRKNEIKWHIKSHVLELGQSKKQKCPICKKYFDYSYFYNHLKRMHDKDYKNELSIIDTENEVKSKSKVPFMCDKCGKVFTNTSSFKLHCQTHGGELKYKCMFCPYRGLHQGLLKIHIRTHTGDYNYKCKHCPAHFITKSNLNKHMRTHFGPIHFKCKTCDKGFYTKLSLERHHNVDHLGIKNHVCNICGKAFGYRNYMMNHQLKIHKRERLTKGKGRLPNYLVSEIDEKNK